MNNEETDFQQFFDALADEGKAITEFRNSNPEYRNDSASKIQIRFKLEELRKLIYNKPFDSNI